MFERCVSANALFGIDWKNPPFSAIRGLYGTSDEDATLQYFDPDL